MTPSSVSTTIDVRVIAPRERHSAVFAAFRSLGVGDALDIVNDHDPRPLYHQLQAEAPGSFTWDYLQGGPEVWHVSIHKLAQSRGTGGCCGACGGGA